MFKKISVIIPTYNRAQTLDLCLKCLEKSKGCERAEIVIVDDGSSKDQVEYLKKSVKKKQLDVKVFFQNNKGPAAARNYALNKSKGEIIIIINDDTIVGKNFFERHLKFHENNKNINKSLLGPFINHPDVKIEPATDWLMQKTKMHFTYPKTNKNEYQRIPWYYFWTNNISIKRDFFIVNKLKFDTDFMTAAWEDVEFGWRAKNCGLEIFLDNKLIAYHYHYLNFDDILGRFFSHGRGLYTISRKIDYDQLPPLAKQKYRLIAKTALFLIGSKYTIPLIEKYLRGKRKINNLLMQILMINQKIKGFDYQKGIRS